MCSTCATSQSSLRADVHGNEADLFRVIVGIMARREDGEVQRQVARLGQSQVREDEVFAGHRWGAARRRAGNYQVHKPFGDGPGDGQ